MKAILFHQHGPPDVLQYTDAPDPTIRANEVLVRVKACSLNHLDLWVRQGLPNVPIPLPHIPGSDVSGEIAQTGAEVTTVRVGQKVVLIPGVTCGKCAACLSGQDNRCRQFTNLGSSIPLVFQTAWHMLVGRAELQPGDDVLILGAGSGVGSAAIQIAKFFGARVITTAGTGQKLQKAKELGADHLINHKTQKIREEVRRITNKRGVDVVFEHVGTATWEDSLASLAVGGRLITCGATTGYDAKIDLRFLFSRQLSLLGSYMGTKSELHTVMKLVASGRLKPVVDRVFPLAEAAAAHTYLESSSQFGKVVFMV